MMYFSYLLIGGYYLTPYSFTLIPDGRTSSDIDLGKVFLFFYKL